MRILIIVFILLLFSCNPNAEEWQTILVTHNEDVTKIEYDHIFYSFKIDENGEVENNTYTRLAGFTFHPTDQRKNTAEIGLKWNGNKFDIVAYYIIDCQLSVHNLIEVGEEWFDIYIKHDHANRYAVIQANGKAVEINYTTDLFSPLELQPSLRRSCEDTFSLYRK